MVTMPAVELPKVPLPVKDKVPAPMVMPPLFVLLPVNMTVPVWVAEPTVSSVLPEIIPPTVTA